MKKLIFCAVGVAMFSNVANAAMCKDFDDDMNLVEYECGTSLSAAIKANKAKEVKKSTTTSVAATSSNMYVAVGGVYLPSVHNSFVYKDLDAGYGIRLAAGMSFRKLRVEGELKYTDGAKYEFHDSYYDGYYGWWKIKEEYVNSQLSIMGNGYYDIIQDGNFGLFVTGGIGLVYDTMHLTYESGYFDDAIDLEEWLFVYQIGGGISYNMNSNLSFDLMYRRMKQVFYSDVSSHEISLGVRYKFGYRKI